LLLLLLGRLLMGLKLAAAVAADMSSRRLLSPTGRGMGLSSNILLPPPPLLLLL
jgi:hypothetical protein